MAADAEFTYGYRGGVYKGTNATDVDHDVEVVGWGVQDGQPYWHIRNSWGAPSCRARRFLRQRSAQQSSVLRCCASGAPQGCTMCTAFHTC
jgi:cathepsin X